VGGREKTFGLPRKRRKISVRIDESVKIDTENPVAGGLGIGMMQRFEAAFDGALARRSRAISRQALAKGRG